MKHPEWFLFDSNEPQTPREDRPRFTFLELRMQQSRLERMLDELEPCPSRPSVEIVLKEPATPRKRERLIDSLNPLESLRPLSPRWRRYLGLAMMAGSFIAGLLSNYLH